MAPMEGRLATRLREVEAAVVEERQIVSFKWIAREFDVSAKDARKLLEDFAQGENKDKIKRVHLLSGWTKPPKRSHVVQLVPEEKLSEMEAGLEKVTSKYIYSIQPCALKDPGAMWSAEYMQIDTLFSEPADATNSLRDNRMSSISCKEVRREAASQVGTGPVPRERKAKAEVESEAARPGGLGASGGAKPAKSGGGISLSASKKPSSRGLNLKPKQEAKSEEPRSKGFSLDRPKKRSSIGVASVKKESPPGGGVSLKKNSAGAKTAGLSISSKRPTALLEEDDEDDMVASKKPSSLGRGLLLSEDESDSEASMEEEEADAEVPEEDPEPEKAEMELDEASAEPQKKGLSLSLGRGSRGGSSRPKKKMKTFINDKGEEVCMEVDEGDEGENTNPNPPTSSTPPPKPAAPKVKAEGVENKKPTQAGKPKAKANKEPAGKKRQMGIASFFARK
ncbi:subunit Cdc27 of DNA polymerase [Chloropicon primus]|uniref:DNA polymerase delta subunit 3 n=2 Tax=Chloropicon primus TaxID=1764295 RepID=A0A5B8MM49_9CHLO|nr:hypothetical protein A3770_05p38590 [Chloropicon primus]UPR00557.1 subunit Cdc27 of DNA polymerase [Chloropicon primus]|eukprot:QDZ21341.1 hypothetical protein A3770_05p38590 [Chloropicon primus]